MPERVNRWAMGILKVSYEYASNGDDFGRLRFVVETEDFAGRGGFWVQWQDVEEFAAALEDYPLSKDAPPMARWGFEDVQGNNLILGLAIRPIDARGTLGVSVEIADELEPKNRVRVELKTHYPQVAAFRERLFKIMRREADEATLTED